MAVLLNTNPATGGPGIVPRWTRSDKDGVGTAYSALSRVWFTLSKGVLNEVSYATIDRPQIRDLQYLVTDGKTFFRDERQLDNTHECLVPDTLGYRIINADPQGRYELATGHDGRPFIRAMEGFATPTGLLPEQVWAFSDQPKAHMYLGRSTGGAMPLSWAHAEYIKLIRSSTDGRVFDLIPEVADRYRNRRKMPPMEIWKFNLQMRSLPAGGTLRIQAAAPFRLHWTCNEWKHARDTDSVSVGTSHENVDIPVSPGQLAPIRFTFFWTTDGRWEGRDFRVGVNETGKGEPLS